MTFYYCDTSAIAKRYIAEQGTNWMRTISRSGSGNIIITARISEVELTSALARRGREGHFDARTIAGYRRLLNRHFQNEYIVIELNASIAALANDLLLKHPLRAYDAIQLATAIISHRRLTAQGIGLIFLSADSRLRQAAITENLMTDDPNLRP